MSEPDKADEPGAETYLGDLGSTHGPAADGGRAWADALAALALLSTELGETRAHVGELRAHLDDVLKNGAAAQAQLDSLPALSGEVTALAAMVAQLLDQGVDEGPPLPVDLAHIALAERGQVLAELVGWVRDVLFTGWPWTQACLRACWLHHPDLVNAVLWLRTAYLAAYGHPSGRAHHAADFHRWLDEVMRWAAERTKQCPPPGSQDGPPHPVPLPPRDDLALLGEVTRRDVLGEIYTLLQVVNAPGAAADVVAQAQEKVSELTGTFGVSQREYAVYEQRLAAGAAHRAVERIAEQTQPPG